MFKFLKRFNCKHKWVYRGIGGGMGFLFRKVECGNCGKKQESLTYTSPYYDLYVSGQSLSKSDFKRFNSEVK